MMSATTISLASGLHSCQDASDIVANRFPFAGASTEQLPEFQQECAHLLLFLALAQVLTHGTPLRSLANFMLTRGPHAFLGHSWKGCSKCVQLRSRSSDETLCLKKKRADRQYAFPAALNADYVRKPSPSADADPSDPAAAVDWQGEPTGLCKETSPGSEVFTRDWTRATVQMSCKEYSAKITMKDTGRSVFEQ